MPSRRSTVQAKIPIQEAALRQSWNFAEHRKSRSPSNGRELAADARVAVAVPALLDRPRTLVRDEMRASPDRRAR